VITQNFTFVPSQSGLGTVNVQVNYARGTPVQGGNATLYSNSGVNTGTTNASGQVSFNNVPVGPFSVQVTRPDGTYDQNCCASGIVVTAGDVENISITFAPIVTLQVSVLGPSNVPVSGASVSYNTGDGYQSWGTTNSSGNLTVPDLQARTYSMFVQYGPQGTILARPSVTLTAAEDGTVVPLVVNVPYVGTVSCHVYAADAVTPVVSASVAVVDTASGTTVSSLETDSTGSFSAQNIAIGDQGFVVTVTSPVDGSMYTDTGSFNGFGDTETANFTLPVSVVAGQVLFTDGTAVQYPQVFVSQTDSFGNTNTFFVNTNDGNGNYTVLGVAPGAFSVNVQDSTSGLDGTANGTMGSNPAVDAIVNVTMAPSGNVSGVVNDSNGNPVAYIPVQLISTGSGFQRYAYADVNGNYSFTHVALGSFVVQVSYISYAGASSGQLTTDGQSVTANITLAATGTVSGQVLQGTTPVAYSAVVVENNGIAGGLTQFLTYSDSDALGNYTVSGVPVGTVQVAAFPPYGGGNVGGLSLGTLSASSNLSLNVDFGNAVSDYYGPYDLDGSDGFRYDVGCGGVISNGGTTSGTQFAFAPASSIVFNGSSPFCSYLEYGTLAQNGREFDIGPQNTDAVRVSRRIFVPAVGGYVRYLEVLTNNSSTAIPLGVTVYSSLNSNTNMLLVSDPATNGNTFAVTQDSTGATPIASFVFDNSGAAIPSVTPQFAAGSGFVSYSWNVNVGAGQTIILMHFVLQHSNSDLAGAQAQIQQLLTLTDPNELSGMSATDIGEVVNFKMQ
jgi:hypothetical protein